MFHTLWSEATDNSSVISGRKSGNFTLSAYGEYIHSKVRRFVVVKEGKVSCTAIPMTTYNGQGVGKKGVKKSDHVIVHTGKTAPAPMPGEKPNITENEAGMQPFPIRIDPDLKTDALSPESRLDFGKPCPIHHNVKVKSFGMVNRASLQALISQWRDVSFGDEQIQARLTQPAEPPPASPSGESMTTPSAAIYRQAYISLRKDQWSEESALAVLAPYRSLLGATTADQRSGTTAIQIGHSSNGDDHYMQYVN